MKEALKRVLIAPAELVAIRSDAGLADQCAALLRQQRESWELLRRGYESLSNVESRMFAFNGFQVTVQFNAQRITSSAAKVDEKSLRERKCFLCSDHLPNGQRGILYRGQFLILCNPYPIFPEHFTIPHIEHRPQEILPALATMLDLTADLSPRYTVAYNGPRCGASAPDHLHLHAGTGGFMPFESEVRTMKVDQRETIFDTKNLSVTSLTSYCRTVIVVEGSNRDLLENAFQRIYEAYQRISGGNEEPLMNLVSMLREGRWTLGMFTRSKHRPSAFYAEGEEKLLVSPAAVDMCGILTLPRAEDFRRFSRDLVARIFEEVSLEEEKFVALKAGIKQTLRSA
jgi:hypothetical protein